MRRERRWVPGFCIPIGFLTGMVTVTWRVRLRKHVGPTVVTNYLDGHDLIWLMN